MVGLSSLVTACAAPPMGFGGGARPIVPGADGRSGKVAGGVGVGVGRDRSWLQADGAMTYAFTRWFSLAAGVTVTRIDTEADGRELDTTGGFPYLRPRLQLGPWSVATGLAGMAFGAGGGGLAGGIADVQVGYGAARWSVYAGAYKHAFEVTGEEPTSASADQLRLGGEYAWQVGALQVGLAIELYRHHDRLRNDDLTRESRLLGGGLKLRVDSPMFR